MKHLSGIAAVISIGLVMRFWEDTRIGIDVRIHNTDSGVSLNTILFWVLMIVAIVWLLLSGYVYVHGHLSGNKQREDQSANRR